MNYYSQAEQYFFDSAEILGTLWIFLSAKKDRVDVAPGRLIRNQTGRTRNSSFCNVPMGINSIWK
jgi:hypothetical protein